LFVFLFIVVFLFVRPREARRGRARPLFSEESHNQSAAPRHATISPHFPQPLLDIHTAHVFETPPHKTRPQPNPKNNYFSRSPDDKKRKGQTRVAAAARLFVLPRVRLSFHLL
jgi:hypothetical protein